MPVPVLEGGESWTVINNVGRIDPFCFNESLRMSFFVDFRTQWKRTNTVGIKFSLLLLAYAVHYLLKQLVTFGYCIRNRKINTRNVFNYIFLNALLDIFLASWSQSGSCRGWCCGRQVQ